MRWIFAKQRQIRQQKSKVIYPKYSKHWPYTVAHIIDYVCSKVLNHGLNHGLCFFTFQVFWMIIHPKLNKFRLKRLDGYIVSDLRFLFKIQAILPETSPFLFAQMTVLSSFFQMFIVLGMHNFGIIIKGCLNAGR